MQKDAGQNNTSTHNIQLFSYVFDNSQKSSIQFVRTQWVSIFDASLFFSVVERDAQQ